MKSLVKVIESLNKRLVFTFLRILFRNKNMDIPLDVQNVKRVLFLRYDAIGDMIVTLPSMRLLKSYNPDIKIDIIASNRNKSIVQDDDGINEVYILENGIFSMLSQLMKIRKNNYDVIFSLVFNKTTKAGLISNIAGKSNIPKVTIRHESRHQLYSTFFNVQLPAKEYRKKITMMEIQSILVSQTFGLDKDVFKGLRTIQLAEKNREFAENRLSSYLNKTLVIYNISSGDDYRTLSIQKNVNVLEALVEKFPNFNYLIISAPSEQDKSNKIAEKFDDRVKVLEANKDFLNICAIISQANFVFTPDTSIVHVAAAFDVPIFLMYSLLSSHFEEWLPYGVSNVAIATDGPNRLETIDTQQIINGFIELVEKNENRI